MSETDALAELELATRVWQRQIDLDARIARTRADIPLLDAEARGGHPFAVSNAQAARDHLAHLERERLSLGDAKGDYERAAQAREQEVATAGSPGSTRLTEIAHERGRATALIVELDEAIAAGLAAEHAVGTLRQAMDALWHASSVDGAIGFNPFADAAKHQRRTEAAALVVTASTALEAFARELADVHQRPTFGSLPSLEVHGMVTTLDLLGSRVAETVTALGISRATNQVTWTLTSVRGLLGQLHARRAEAQRALDGLGAERHTLLQRG